MPVEKIIYQPIGTIQSPFKTIEAMPIQPSGASGIQGKLILQKAFVEGLKDLEDFSHIILLYHFHQVNEYQLTVTPFLDSKPHGVFCTRAPKRPNPIGLSIVKLLSIEENVLLLENVDLLDGTPVLDIKPFVPIFDQPENVRAGWLNGSGNAVKSKRSDNRFK